MSSAHQHFSDGDARKQMSASSTRSDYEVQLTALPPESRHDTFMDQCTTMSVKQSALFA